MKKLIVRKDDLKNNIEIVKNIAGEKTKIIGIVKGNGMGLDLIQYSKFLVENGINFLGVAQVEEALKLRECGIEANILLLTPEFDEEILKELIENKIILTVSSKKQVEILENMDYDNVQVHVKIDTGFARYGFLYYNEQEILEMFQCCKKVEILGTYTHFSKAFDEKSTRKQFERFIGVINFLKSSGQDVGIVHCSESIAFLKYPEMRLDAVRLGSIVTGRTLQKVEGLKKIGQFTSNIQEIKVVPKGYNISYGNMYKTKKKTKIAVIPTGYIDGLNMKKDRDIFSFVENVKSVGIEVKRLFRDNKIKVKIRNKNYNIIGRLGMYHCVCDVTDAENIEIGDKVELEIAPIMVNSEINREYI